jgi:hypothetical protein
MVVVVAMPAAVRRYHDAGGEQHRRGGEEYG